MRDLISKGLLTAAAASSVLSLSSGYATAVEADGAAVGSPGVLSGNNVQVPVEIPINVCGNTVDPVGVLNPAFGNACANTSGTSAHSSEQASSVHGRPSSPSVPPARQSHPAPPSHGAPPANSTRPAPQADDEHTPPGHIIHRDHAPKPDGGGSTATGLAQGSPGVGSGNNVAVPIDVPVNLCGNSVDVVGVLNPVFGNFCGTKAAQATPRTPHVPAQPPGPQRPDEPVSPVGPGVPSSPADRAVPPAPAPHGPAHPGSAPAADAPAGPRLASTGADSHLFTGAALSAGLLLGGAILYRRSTAATRR
ncbi:chaplin family protein [Streptomyces hebeiensis]